MKKGFKILSVNVAIITAIFILSMIAVRYVYSGKLDLAIFYPGSSNINVNDIVVEFEPEGICELDELSVIEDYLVVSVKAVSKGTCEVNISEKGEMIDLDMLKVGFMNTVTDLLWYRENGLPAKMLTVSIYITFLMLSLIISYFVRKKEEMYSYSMIFTVGMALFLSFAFLLYWMATILCFLNPYDYTGRSILGIITSAGVIQVFLTIPLFLIFGVFLVASNISLVRHEGMAKRNLLGAVLVLLLVGGTLIGVKLFTADFSGSEFEAKIDSTINSVYISLLSFAECMLAGAAICSRSAVRKKMPLDRDYIIILGCGIKEDGTLYPLLKGRVDNAIKLYRDQLEKNGKTAILLPSGGQGPDEVCSEAEAMKNYLLSEGIPAEHILTEDKSTTTFENMKFSKAIIEAENPDAKVAFSTTNYHVFRSGVWAERAGLHAQGTGARTKWYFWPNALLRELAGLFAEKWKQILFTVIVFMTGIGVINWFV